MYRYINYFFFFLYRDGALTVFSALAVFRLRSEAGFGDCFNVFIVQMTSFNIPIEHPQGSNNAINIECLEMKGFSLPAETNLLC